MIVLEQLRKRYPEFDMEIDLRVESGELVSVLGPSGSGKTTTLRLIAGFERPDTGRVIVNDRDVTTLSPAERRIGYVFQEYTLFPHMNVAQNVGYGLRVRREDPRAIDRRVDELLEVMELPGFGPRRVETLSGGERQRVAIARALAVDPVLLMLDEPFSSIDEVLRSDLRREIVRLQRELGITVLFVTHSRQEALSISNRVAVLEAGRLVQYASPEQLYRAPRNRFIARFVGDVSFPTVAGRTLMVRPEDVRLIPQIPRPGERAGAEVRSTASSAGSAERIRVSARIHSRQFLGFAWRYELESDAGPLIANDTRCMDEGRVVQVDLPADAAAPEEESHG